MSDGSGDTVSDSRLIVELLVADRKNEYLLPEQVASGIHQLSVHEVRERLNNLATTSDYVERREVGSRLQYRLNDAGRDYLRQLLRDDLP